MGGVNRNLTHTSIDEIETVGPKSVTGVTIGKDKELEVVVSNVFEPFRETCAVFCIKGSHGLAKCKG